MDGYPSDSAQAAIFLQLIGMPTAVIYLDIPESVMSQRLKDRYNFDDEVHSIMNRIEKFKKNTLPLIRKWNGVKIDANQEPKKVFEDIKTALDPTKVFKEIELPTLK